MMRSRSMWAYLIRRAAQESRVVACGSCHGPVLPGSDWELSEVRADGQSFSVPVHVSCGGRV